MLQQVTGIRKGWYAQKSICIYLSVFAFISLQRLPDFRVGWQVGCSNAAVIIPSLWDSHDFTSDVIKREGHSKPKRKSNKIANIDFSHPTKYLLWRGSWVSWKWCRDGNAIQFPSGHQDSHQVNASLLLHGAMPSSRVCPGSAMLAFPGMPLAVHVHKLQVGEKEEAKEHFKYCCTLFDSTELGGLIFTMTQFLMCWWQWCCHTTAPSQINFKHFIISKFKRRWLRVVLEKYMFYWFHFLLISWS